MPEQGGLLMTGCHRGYPQHFTILRMQRFSLHLTSTQHLGSAGMAVALAGGAAGDWLPLIGYP
jgi:hypothetical protein